MSLNRMYPYYVTTPMIHRWSSPNYVGDFTTDTMFQRTSPSYSSGSSGSGSSSFGGGGSGGGGGGGGSW